MPLNSCNWGIFRRFRPKISFRTESSEWKVKNSNKVEIRYRKSKVGFLTWTMGRGLSVFQSWIFGIFAQQFKSLTKAFLGKAVI